MRALILRRVGLLESGSDGPIIVGPRRQRRRAAAAGLPRAATAIRISALDPDNRSLRQNPGRALPCRPASSADRAVPERQVAAQPRRERPRPLHRAGAARSIPTSSTTSPSSAPGRPGSRPRSMRPPRGCRRSGPRLPRLRRPGRRLRRASRTISAFPTGISGMALMARAYNQAQKFGVEMAIPDEAALLERCRTTRRRRSRSMLGDGEALRTRTVVIASGARYRRLDVADLAQFEGTCVHYWASPHRGAAVRRPGGGAGRRRQFGRAGRGLPGQPGEQSGWLLVRGRSLEATMSRYLVERIAAQPNIEVLTRTEISALEGEDGDARARCAGATAQRARRRRGRSAICSCSSAPTRTPTGWRNRGIALDAKGFVRTGELAAAHGRCWKRAAPACSPSATCAPGRSSGSPPRSAKAPRWWRRCMRISRDAPAVVPRALAIGRPCDGGRMHTRGEHPRRDAQRAGLRGMPEDGFAAGCICGSAAPAAMSAAATTRRTGTPPSIFTPPAIRSSKATIRPKAGAGAMSTRSCSTSATIPRRRTARSRAFIEPRQQDVHRDLKGKPGSFLRPTHRDRPAADCQRTDRFHVPVSGTPRSPELVLGRRFRQRNRNDVIRG